MLARHQLRQILLFLRGGAVTVNLVHTQIRMRAIRKADRSRGPRDLFHRDHVRGVTHVGATVLFRHRHAEHTQVAEFLPQVHRKLIGAVDLSGARGDFLCCKTRETVAQHFDLFTERELQTGQVTHCSVSRNS